MTKLDPNQQRHGFRQSHLQKSFRGDVEFAKLFSVGRKKTARGREFHVCSVTWDGRGRKFAAIYLPRGT
jgi:hypothetical protein